MRKRLRHRTSFPGKNPNTLWILFLLLGLGFGYLFWYHSVHKDREAIPFSAFLSQVESENVHSVAINDQQVQGEFKKPVVVTRPTGHQHPVKYFETIIISPDRLWEKLHSHKVMIEVYQNDRQNWVTYLYLLGLLFLLFLVPLYFFLRQGQGGGGGKIFTVGKSKAKFFSPNTIKIKFKDVAGVHEAKEDLNDVVDFLRNPEKYKRLGAKIPRGVLLVGAPGNGKTMLAKAVAGEANCPFFSVSGSDFVEVFVGVGASRVRDLFAQAKRHAPCIVFIDEIDAVGRHRGVGVGGGNDEREQTLNQLLSEMDGFSTDGGIIVLAATNRPDVLDRALLRPGRFDRKVDVPYPDLISREQILNIHMEPVTLADNVDLHRIARGTARFSGADLANLVNEAALLASKNNKEAVGMDDFELARDKILVGAERKTLMRTEEEIKQTAYHESGHTLVNVLLADTQPLHKVTILSRGGALGVTWYLPQGDELSKSEGEIRSEIKVCLGGRIAEELVYGVPQRTTGALSDLKVATRLARDMVRLYGMSELGPLTFENTEGRREYSEVTAEKIDQQVSKILDACYQETQKMLTDNRARLDDLANALVEKETLDASEVYSLLNITPKAIQSFRHKKDAQDLSDSDEDEHGAS